VLGNAWVPGVVASLRCVFLAGAGHVGTSGGIGLLGVRVFGRSVAVRVWGVLGNAGGAGVLLGGWLASLVRVGRAGSGWGIVGLFGVRVFYRRLAA
jgi:hypothetical protein